MPTQCNPNRFAFAPAEGRPVVASFDGGAITSDAGALLLGATDRVLLATLAGKLAATRADCAPLAGKSTLNRLELSKLEPTRYARIAADTAAIESLFVDLFLNAHDRPPAQITLDLDATDDPLHGRQEGRFFHGYYDCYCYLPLYG